MELNKSEMETINGGAISWGTIGCIGGILAYLIGVLSGYTNPNRCNN